MKKFLFLAFAGVLLAALPARAESLTLQIDKTVERHAAKPGDEKAAPASARQAVTLYPAHLVVKSGNEEKIYDFGTKSLIVLNHADKTYLVYPLHSIPIWHNRERMSRLAMKISMHKALLAKGKAVGQPSLEDVDLDMLFAARSNSKSDHLLSRRKDGDKTVFFSKEGTLAAFQTRSGTLPKPLKKAYARYLTYETSLHPVVEKALTEAPQVFSTLEYTNRDPLRGTRAVTTLTLAESSAGADSTPSMPEGYTRLYSTNPEMAEIIARSVTIPPPDFAALDQKLRALIAENRPFEAYLTASELALMLSAADFQKHIGILTPGLKAGSLFEAGTVSAITRHPGSEKDLETFIQILDNAKEKAGEKAYLLDLFKANHTRNVLGRKSDLTEADEQKLAEARQLIIGALRANPRLVGAHIDLGSSHFQSFDIMEAFLLWDHAERLAPAHDSLANILRMKSEAERDFPEYF